MSLAPATPVIPAAVLRKSAQLLGVLLPHRRASDPSPAVDAQDFPVQLRAVAALVAADRPIHLTLPGFPCKSPSPRKVLGVLPDEGERLALRFLDSLCARIEALYPPGARLTVCSDGHVFGDLIQVPDAHIDAYADELAELIHADSLTGLALFDLRQVFGDLPHDRKRALVQQRFAPTLESCAPRSAATRRHSPSTAASPASSPRTRRASPAPARRCNATAGNAPTA